METNQEPHLLALERLDMAHPDACLGLPHPAIQPLTLDTKEHSSDPRHTYMGHHDLVAGSLDMLRNNGYFSKRK